MLSLYKGEEDLLKKEVVVLDGDEYRITTGGHNRILEYKLYEAVPKNINGLLKVGEYPHINPHISTEEFHPKIIEAFRNYIIETNKHYQLPLTLPQRGDEYSAVLDMRVAHFKGGSAKYTYFIETVKHKKTDTIIHLNPHLQKIWSDIIRDIIISGAKSASLEMKLYNGDIITLYQFTKEDDNLKLGFHFPTIFLGYYPIYLHISSREDYQVSIYHTYIINGKCDNPIFQNVYTRYVH